MDDVGYRAGDWFVVPLDDGTHAPGRVARHQPPHGLVGYLFAPREQVPTLDEVATLDAADALAVLLTSGRHVGGPWPLLGGGDGFDHDAWTSTAGDHERTPTTAMSPGAAEVWFLHQVTTGALRPRRDSVGQVEQPAPTDTPGAPPPDLVLVVIPGAPGPRSRLVETVLRLTITPSVGEVDGTEHWPEGTEVFVYGPDARRLARRVGALVRFLVPAGSHLKVRASGDEWVVPLRGPVAT